MIIAASRAAMIYNIQPFSLHDGPGCRTTIFFKGCPLSCRWCANPESWRRYSQPMLFLSRCQGGNGCQQCMTACERQAWQWQDDTLRLDSNKCAGCNNLHCISACSYQALEQCGKNYQIDEIIKLLQRDRKYWAEDGGVTFSGGEPLLQVAFVAELAKWCREQYIHTAIETSAYADRDDFWRVLQNIDFAFIDLKMIDANRHRHFCGQENERILQNIAFLQNNNWSGRLIIRIPLVAGVNDDTANIQETIRFMHRYNCREINLLPYHNLGTNKWQQCGSDYQEKFSTISSERLAEIADVFLQHNVLCYIADDTPF